jgi:hypothetical protein
MPDGELVTAGYVSVVFVCKFCVKSSGRLDCNCRFVGPEVRMGWKIIKLFGLTLVDDVSDGFNIKAVVQIGDGSAPGIGTDHS